MQKEAQGEDTPIYQSRHSGKARQNHGSPGQRPRGSESERRGLGDGSS
jgi:hypothetical protein